ncbi:MAG TPA: hypothetical protein VE377_14015 [Candidatus Dormibacteraeota bacterium]|nr:hypothetical protein [Candidatus Dormibacteraeota bacterium]
MAVEELAKTLTVPFAAGFVVQRFLEIVDPFTVKFIKDPATKKIVLGIVSLSIGMALAASLHLRIFHDLLQFDCDDLLMNLLDYFATGVFISGGTEGFNSLLKFANYKKEATKGDAVNKLKDASSDAIKKVNAQ